MNVFFYLSCKLNCQCPFLHVQVFCQPLFPNPSPALAIHDNYRKPSELEESEQPEDADEQKLDDNAIGASSTLDSYTVGCDTDAPLQDAESSPMVTGHMEIDLNMNTSLFLEPLLYEISDNHAHEIHHSCLRQTDSLKYYEHICSHCLHFEEPEIDFSRTLYKLIDSNGVGGISISDISSNLNELHTTLGMEAHIQALINFEMVRHCL